MSERFTYESCVQSSERVAWKVNEVLGDEKFDTSRPFLPETLAQTGGIECLSPAEKLKLNQIRGLTYAHLFGFVEEFILREVIGLAAQYGGDRSIERRALLRFAEEEVKHQILFERTRAALLKVLGECGLVPGASDVAGFILGKSQLAVMVLTAMLEWTTQHHYTEMFRPGEEKERLDPGFLRIFKAHWLEEAQHAKLDNLETERLAKSVSAAERDKAIDEVLELGGAFDGLLKSQAELDIASLERACGRTFTAAEKAEILARQHRAYRYTFLVSGLTHKSVIDLVGTVSAQGPAKFAAAATALSA